MKYIAKKSSTILCILLTGIMLCSFTPAVVTEQTPTNTEKGGTIWTRSFSQQTTSYNSVPIVTDTSLYIVNENILYELNVTGEIVRRFTLAKKMNSVCFLLYENGNLYIPLSGGVIQCIDTNTFSSLWVSDSFGGQSLSHLLYHDGYLYAGTTSMLTGSSTKGIFYCLNATNGTTVWHYEDTKTPGGYYWSGGVTVKNRLYFAGDNGELISHSLLTEEIYERMIVSSNANIRSSLLYDDRTDALYAASNDGKIHQIKLNSDGSLGEHTTLDLHPYATVKNCTSTPTIYQNSLYIGSFADNYGYLSVIDTRTFTLRYQAQGNKGADIKSTPLVSTGYQNEKNHNVYIYVTYNAPPGGIYLMTDTETAVSGTLHNLYSPYTAKQFCLSDIVCGPDGTLYYSNDSGTLFAVREVDISSDRLSTPTPVPLPATPSTPVSSSKPPSKEPSSLPVKVTKPKKPSKIRVKKKKKNRKKTYTIHWKKNTKNSQTILYIKQNSSWKKKIIKKKSHYTFSSAKKKIQIRLRSRYKKNGAWIYSSYTKTKKLS